MTDDDLADWDAAYVLGALSLEDRRTYEAYLAANPARAADLTEFTGLPGILNALSREEALALIHEGGDVPADGPVDMMPSLAQAAAKRQRRSRRTFVTAVAAAAAAFLIAGGVVGATVFPRSTRRRKPWRCRRCRRPHAAASPRSSPSARRSGAPS